ncbi:hypothetical protein RSAG8_06404, partial [Rhizoctonia solani AG-8 WAC10335]
MVHTSHRGILSMRSYPRPDILRQWLRSVSATTNRSYHLVELASESNKPPHLYDLLTRWSGEIARSPKSANRPRKCDTNGWTAIGSLRRRSLLLSETAN